jgi:hypothetical protein
VVFLAAFFAVFFAAFLTTFFAAFFFVGMIWDEVIRLLNSTALSSHKEHCSENVAYVHYE